MIQASKLCLLLCFLGQFFGCRTFEKNSNQNPEPGSEASKGLNIYNGNIVPAGSALRKSVFEIAVPTESGAESTGTGFSMIRPRCIWTAGHVVGERMATVNMKDSTGALLKKADVIARKVFNHTPLPSTDDPNPYPGGRRESHDLAILWTNAVPNHLFYLKESDYNPLALGSAEDLELESTLLDYGTFPFAPNSKVLDIYGYGLDEDQKWGVLKKGTVDAHGFHKGDTPVQNYYYHGSWIRTIPHNQGGGTVTATCPGDSGGPVLNSGSVVGVITAMDRLPGAECQPASMYFTGIEKADDSRLVAPSSTKHMMRFESERVCAKHLTVSHVDQQVVEVVTKVSVTPPQIEEFDDDTGLNNSIDCGANDCIEHMHPGQSITIEAKIIKAGYEFDKWEDNMECPCGGSSNPICVVSYSSILDTWEQNRALCVPVPKQAMPGSDDGMGM